MARGFFVSVWQIKRSYCAWAARVCRCLFSSTKENDASVAQKQDAYVIRISYLGQIVTTTAGRKRLYDRIVLELSCLTETKESSRSLWWTGRSNQMSQRDPIKCEREIDSRTVSWETTGLGWILGKFGWAGLFSVFSSGWGEALEDSGTTFEIVGEDK